MFTSGSHTAVSPGEKTLRGYLINRTCTSCTCTESTSTEGINGQNIQVEGLDWTRPSDVNAQMWSDGKAGWETLNEDSNQACLGLSPRPFCGHTTCGDKCLYQTYDTTEVSEVKNDVSFPENVFRPEEEQKLQWEVEMQSQGAQEEAQEGDVLQEIDFSLRQLLDAELDAFRVNVHNLVSEHYQQYRQLLVPENEAVKDQRNPYDTQANGDAAWSPMNTAEQPQIEESSNSSYSIQDDDCSQHYRPNLTLEDEVNRSLIRLLTSASKVSHELRSKEYAT